MTQNFKDTPMTYWRLPLDADDIPVTRGKVHVVEDRCKGCGYCISYCPKKVLAPAEHYNQKGYHPPEVQRPEECVNCHYCESICPEFAIFSVEIPVSPDASRKDAA